MIRVQPDPIGHLGGGRGLSAVGGGDNVVYTIRDDFTAAVAAGALNGTAATPGPGTRVAIDTAGTLMSIDASGLVFNKTSIAGDPGLWYDAITRAPGGIFTARVISPDVYGGTVGFDLDQTGVIGGYRFAFGSTNVIAAVNTTVQSVIGAITYLVPYDITIILRAIGADFYIRGGTEYPVTTLLWRSVALNTTPLYLAAVGGHTNVKYMRYTVQTPYLTVPLVSEGFGSGWGTTDGKGHVEGVTGGLGSGGSGVTWTAKQGTWGVTSSRAKSTALDAGGVAIATVPVSSGNYIVDSTLTRSDGITGVVLHYVDSDNYVYAGHDGTNAIVIKRVGGTETTVLTEAKAFGAGECRVIWDNGTIEMYWNWHTGTTSRVQTGGVIADAVFTSAKTVGLYSTNTGNTHDNFVAYDRGT
jgi:hypothetical protein